MMIECEKHKPYQSGVQLSPDLKKAIQSGGIIPKFRMLQYSYLGDICDEFFLSEDFCEIHNISEKGEIELPRQYPEWIHELAGICEKCFQEVVKV